MSLHESVMESTQLIKKMPKTKKAKKNNNTEGTTKDPRHRDWCFTWNNYAEHTELPKEKENDTWWDRFTGLVFGIMQLEKGEETGKLHLQGYLEFRNGKRFSTLHKEIPGAHLTERLRAQRSAIDYCKKEDTRVDGPWKYGSPKEQGKDGKLKEMVIEIKKGRTIADLVAEDIDYAICYIKNSRGLEKIQYLLHSNKPRTWETQFIVIVGEPGAGKTTTTLKQYPNAYWKTAGKWWDKYIGQDTVVLDEFVGWLPYHELMRLGDSSPLDLESKGGNVVFLAKKVVLISNKFPWDWYNYNEHKLDRESLFRRIKEVYYYQKGQEPRKFTEWNAFIEFCKENNII